MVKVKNIYYMLSYAYQNLSRIGYKKLGAEDHDNVQDLLAAILAKGVSAQLKEGLTRDYETVCEITGMPRGKVNFADSIKNLTFYRHKLACEYGLYSENNIFNQILKSTMLTLIHSRHVSSQNKSQLKKLVLYFSDVSEIDCSSINWLSLGHQQNSKSYRLLMNICFLVVKGLLLTVGEGKYQLAEYMDEQQMHRLYEKFVLAYFQKERPEFRARSAYIDWNTDDDYIDFLPQMKSDIILEYKGHTLIIDTKYYSHSMRTSQYGTKETMIAAHLYQIFAYVKNYDKDATGMVRGMVLYAKTDEDIVPNNTYHLSGNQISLNSLDLDADWKEIVDQLEAIATDFVSVA